MRLHAERGRFVELRREGGSSSERWCGGAPGSTVQDPTAAFEEFFGTERTRLHRILFAITGSRSEAEDIAQDAFLRVWERWTHVGALEDPAGYPHRTAMNVLRDRRRGLVRSLGA